MKQTLKNRNPIFGTVLFLFFLFSGFTTFNVNAQQKIVGTVSDSSGNPLPGVSVMQKGTTNGAVSDFDGNYTITLIKGKKILVFSSLGYKKTEKTLRDETTLNVILKEESEALDEIVIIGYAAVERDKILGSVSTVKAIAIEQATPTQALDGVQGKLAGVQILTNNGPGQGFDIRVRGVSSFGGTDPLYVVDGQQLDNIDNLDPADIASLEVIKDAATASIYGAQAANGVVIITTKTGKLGKTQVTVDTTTGINSLVGDLPVSNAAQRRLYDRATARNSNVPTNQQLDSLSLIERNSVDLQKLVTRAAVRQITNVSLSGGTESIKYRWNNGFVSEAGIVVNSGYKRANTQLRLDFKPSDKFSMGTSINGTFEERDGISEFTVLQQLVERLPYLPVFEPDGAIIPTINARANPLGQALLFKNQQRNFRARIFNYAQLEILPKLTFKATLGVDFRLQKINQFRPGVLNNGGTGDARGRDRTILFSRIQQENFFNYSNDWGDHNLDAFAGMQILKDVREESDLNSSIFNNDYIETFNNASEGSIISTLSGINKNNLYSLFAGVKYNYANKYLFDATVRRDGSSRFGDENEFGVFPSVSLGWRASKESFLENVDVINNLLFRASVGVVGNQNLGNQNYAFTGVYEPGFVYDGISGISQTRLGNSSLKWEESRSINLGLDLSMFKRRLNFNIDVWQQDVSDLLVPNTPLPGESGFTSIATNVGSMTNRGIDLNINATIIKKKDFSWNTNFNISFLNNEVTKLNDPIAISVGGGSGEPNDTVIIEEGQPIGNFWGYQNLGIFQSDLHNAYDPASGQRLTPVLDANGQLQNYTFANGTVFNGQIEQMVVRGRTLEGGDIIWEDLNGDFVIDAEDRQIIGNGLANVFGGFSNDIKYKNFTLGFQFDYSLDFDIYGRWDEIRNDLNTGLETPGPDRILGAWTEDNPITVYPRLARVPQNQLRANSFYVTDGSWVKLRYIRLNYKFSEKIIEKIKFMEGLSLNFAVNNVLTWTNYGGYNPEIGNRGGALTPSVDNLRYPNDREIIIGLRAQF